MGCKVRMAGRILGFFLIIISMSTILFGCSRSDQPDIREGILTLPNDWDGERIKLNGEWEIHWNSWEGNDWVGMDREEKSYVKIPSSWNSYNPNEDKSSGIASYRLIIRNLVPGVEVFFKVKNQTTAYSFYINGKYRSNSGKVGDSPDTSMPQYRVSYVSIVPLSEQLELILTVSNFHHKRGGFRYPIELGNRETILNQTLLQAGFEFMVVGAILAMGLFHFFLYFIRGRKAQDLYFGIFCILNGCRLFVLDNFYITYFFPDTSWNFLVKMDYVTTPLIAPVFIEYLRHSYPADVRKFQSYLVLFLSLGFSLIVLMTSPIFFTSILILNNIIVGFSIAIAMYIVLKINHYKREESRLLLGGTLVLLVFGIHDLLAGSRVIDGDLRLPIGLFLFFIIQVIIVSKRNSRIFIQSNLLKKQLYKSSRKLESLNNEYSKFVPREILRIMGKKNIIDVRCGDSISKNIAILSSDIRDFTTISESMNTEDNFKFLNAYLKRVGPLVTKHNGIIDKYIGDAILALYPNGSQNAIDTAIEMHMIVNEYNKHRLERNYKPISIGVGIHKGEGLLGIIGEDERMQTSAVSESIYLASIIEGLTKKYGAKILISVDALYSSEVFDKYPFRMVDSVKVTPESNPIGIVEILLEGIDDTSNLKIEYKDIFERGVYAFLEGDFQQASDLFEVMIAQIDQDDAARLYYHRSQKYLKYGAPPGWKTSDSMEI